MTRQHRFQRGLVFCTLAALVVMPPLATSEYVPPSEVEVKTEAYTPSQTSFPEGKYHYKVTWQGIPVAKADVAVNRNDRIAKPYYHVKADVKTAKAIDLLYKLRHRTESVFDALTMKPLLFYSWQKENRKEKIRQISFEADGTITSRRWKNGKEREPISFQSENGTLDPMSAAFLARSLPLAVGSVSTFDVFNGKDRFLISFHVENEEMLWLRKGDRRRAFRVHPSVKKLTDSSGTEDRLKGATLWVSADEKREILKLESKVLVGSVNAVLTGYSPDETEEDMPLQAKIKQVAFRDVKPKKTSSAASF